jgi:hypothetical protein
VTSDGQRSEAWRRGVKDRATRSTLIEWSLALGAEAELDEGTV